MFFKTRKNSPRGGGAVAGVCSEQCFPCCLTDHACAVPVCPRVNSSLSSDELLLEDLETEGERQLKSLLHNQLDTTVSIEQ